VTTKPSTTLAEVAARDAEWEPRCQYIKADETTAKGYGHWGGGHPWPMTVAQADGYHLLCGGRKSDHPARFGGPQWNHETFVYDPAEDRDPRADRRFLLELVREAREALIDLAATDPMYGDKGGVLDHIAHWSYEGQKARDRHRRLDFDPLYSIEGEANAAIARTRDLLARLTEEPPQSEGSDRT